MSKKHDKDFLMSRKYATFVANEYAKRIEKAIEYINKCEYQRYCPNPYEKEKYIMREEKEGQDLLNILGGDNK